MKRLALPTAALLLLGPALAAQRAPIDAIFPDSSFGVVRFAGLDRCKDSAQATKAFQLAKQLLAKSGLDVAAMVGHEVDEGMRHAGRELREAGLDMGMLHTLLRGEVAIGVGRPTILFGGTPSILIAIDVHGRQQAAARIVDHLEKMLARHVDEAGIEWAGERYMGVEIRRIQAKRFGFTASYATVDGRLLLGTGTGYLKECIRTSEGQGRSIRRNPAYHRGAELQKHEPIFSAFLNTKPIERMLEPIMPYEARTLGTALGCSGMDGIYWSSSAGAKGSEDVMFFGIPGNDAGVLKGMFRKSSSFAAAKMCPPETIAFATLALDPEACMESCEKLAQFIPGEAMRQMQREFDNEVIWELNKELDDFGMDVGDLEELWSVLGREVSAAVWIERTSPAAAFFVKLDDEAKARDHIVGHLEKVFDGERMPRLRHRKSKNIWFVSERGMQVQPCFTIRNGMLIASPFLKNLEAVLARMDGGGKSLADVPSFRHTLDKCGPASVFLNVRVEQAVTTGWPLARGWIVGQLSEGAPHEVDVKELVPTTEELTGIFGDLTMSAIADEGGFTVRQSHPYGIGSLLALAGWGADWALGRGRPNDR